MRTGTLRLLFLADPVADTVTPVIGHEVA